MNKSAQFSFWSFKKFIYYSLFLVLSFSVNAVDDAPVTGHEHHLRHIGYWSLHQEIKRDLFSFLEQRPSIKGHKGVEYLSHLGQQIETLLSVPYENRLLTQRNELERLSNWVYVISAHACGFSGFDGEATLEEATKMRRALTFSSLVLDAFQPSFSIRVLHESLDPYYSNSSERQFFFKSLLCRREMIHQLWSNHMNGWPAAYYRHVTLSEFLADHKQSHIQAVEELEVYRTEYQEMQKLLDNQNKAKAWGDDEEWSDEEDNRPQSPTLIETLDGSFVKIGVNFRVSKQEVKKMMAMFPAVDEREVKEHRKTILRTEKFLESNKQFSEFREVFLDCFDFEELDSWLNPYIKYIISLVGKHKTARPHVSLFAPYFNSLKDDKEEIIRLINDESYYDDMSNEEDDNQKNVASSRQNNSTFVRDNDELLDHWKKNGTYKQFRHYFKNLYIEEMKERRKAILIVYSEQFFSGFLEGIAEDKAQFFSRKKEYAVLKQRPRQPSTIRLTASHIQSPVSIFNADEVIIDSSINHSSYSRFVSQSSWAGEHSFGQEAYQEARAPSQIHSRTIILGRDTHLTFAESTLLPPDVKIYGGSHSIKKDSPLRSWTQSWSHSSQTIPTPVVCALSIGAGVLTQGLASGLVGVGLGSLSSTAVYATLTGHDPFKAVTSKESLKNLAVQVATAGITDHLSQSLKVNVAPGSKSFVDHLKGNTLRAAVNSSLKIALGDRDINGILVNAVKGIGVNSVAGLAANQIGSARGIGQLDSFTHKALHGVIGGVSGYALRGNEEAIISGAVSAIASEVAFEIMVPKEKIETRTLEIAIKEISRGNNNPQDIQNKVLESFHQEREIAKATAVVASTSLNKEPDIAYQIASNAVDNNCVIALGLRAAPVIYWAIANSDKIIRGIQSVATLYNIYERTDKDAKQQNAQTRKKQDKPVAYPETPDSDEGKLEKDRKYRDIRGTPARECKEDGSIWEPNKGRGHGDIDGEKQWKRWPNKKSWERGDKPQSVWPDGRIRDSKTKK